MTSWNHAAHQPLPRCTTDSVSQLVQDHGSDRFLLGTPRPDIFAGGFTQWLVISADMVRLSILLQSLWHAKNPR
jgi:hypothetical protein